jgi:DNA-binding FadR family transcriptional regulator
MQGSLGNPQQYVDDDVAFHLCIAKASSNELIFDLLTVLSG